MHVFEFFRTITVIKGIFCFSFFVVFCIFLSVLNVNFSFINIKHEKYKIKKNVLICVAFIY